MSNQAFSPVGFGKTLTISASTTNAQASFGYSDATNNGTALLVNAGAATVFVRWGGAAQTATTSDLPVLSGQSVVVDVSGAQHFAAITASGTATLYVVPGNNG